MKRLPSIRQRLLAGAMAIGAASLLVIAAVVALFASVQREFNVNLRESIVEQRAAESIMTAVYAQMLAAYRQIQSPDTIATARFDSLGQVAYARLREYLHQPSMSLRSRVLVEGINETHRSMEVDARTALDLLGRGETAAAARRIAAMEARAVALNAQMDEFIAQRDEERSAMLSARAAGLRRVVAALGTGIVVLTIIGVLFVRTVQRSAVAPLAQLADAARQLGQGDLDTRVPPQRHLELAAAADSFNEMAVRIRDANAARDRSEALYRRLFNDAPIPLYRTSPEGTLLDANPAFLELLGFGSAVDVIGVDVRPWYVLPETRTEFAATMDRSGAITNQRIQLRKANGDAITVLDTTRRVADPETGEESYEGGLVDVTRIDQVERELRHSVERFREMADHINEAFYVVDLPDFRPAYVSPTWSTIWGRPLEQAYHPRIWFDAIHPGDREMMTREQQKVLQGEASEIAFRVVRPDGSIRWVRRRGFPVKNAAGEVRRLVGVSEDITDLRQAEERLNQSQKMEAVGQLAGGVAHDFNNLLTVIIAAAEFLQTELPPDTSHAEDLAEIRRACDSAVGLTQQLLAFSRKQIVEPVVFSLGDTVAETGKMLRRLIGEHITLEIRLRSDARIRADRGQIQQVLTNLAVNARDAMPSGGALIIETSSVTIHAGDAGTEADLAPGDYVALSVSDTGSGMSEEVRAHAFEPFFTTKARGHGTGLGLATCHGIVKQAGGSIDIQSELNVGTTIRVYLPRVAETSDLEPAAAVPPAATGHETILMVEDEPAVRRVGARALRRLGYEVLEARDGVEALRLLGTHSGVVHLLFTDVVLPGLGGRELAQRVKEARPDIKVLFASGYTDDMILQDRLAAQDIMLLQKPYTKNLLSQKIRAALDAWTESRGGP